MLDYETQHFIITTLIQLAFLLVDVIDIYLKHKEKSHPSIK